MPVDYNAARHLLEKIFTCAELDLLEGSAPPIGEHIRAACDTLFNSRTQAYREVLLGCVIARIQDRTINVRQPYVDQGPHSFSGRSLDERSINPFLQERRIPSSKGPYLSVFRRSVQFDPGTRAGLRDKPGYDALLSVISQLERTTSESDLAALLHYLLYRFAQLREAANVSLSRLHRISLEQYDRLISGLLATRSGGRFPVLVVVATFTAISEFFELDWDISWQTINAADAPSGASGDITISSGGTILLAAEVTERSIDRSRVITTFNTKISPAGIEEYLFFTRPSSVQAEARQQAQQYFAQGHEVNFVETKNWILMSLATMGRKGRDSFNKALLKLIDSPDIPRTLKVAWNGQITAILP
ncbi:MAG: hypothetical protein M1370_04430 [Bacteroidetes bacterium]|nr:hypothetical protein [Bacteroidota bacterium]